MMELVHMTATYSNAMLVAILPHISDFAKKLDLPIPQPITAAQVQEFRPSPVKDFIGGGVMLTNGYWFAFNNGYVNSFRSPDNVFCDQDPAAHWPKYAYGKDNMTTNDAIALARESLNKLGYSPELLGCDAPPKSVTGPHDTNDGHHVPHCQIRWERYPAPKTAEEQAGNDVVTVEINMEEKTVAGLSAISKKLWKSPPKLSVEPELESDYKNRNKLGSMFIRTNAPASLPK
ncbi:MAG: hypothetical protein BWX84_02749 [Verrucomicrobia bacterium ADurb.Bin118]|jgi:hypothetical protein|nr:hypothetical protein [Verrucomicrobiota bacterium]OQB88830.1 MAG: hypothetical protein BWX84_02749 [Verrucomicrobia bacterium ADurb.Bin118]